MTYSDLKKTCEAIPRSHMVGESTSNEETKLLNSFFRIHHPDWFEKTNGEEVIKYDVRDSGAYHTGPSGTGTADPICKLYHVREYIES